jgi:hypothetical protein
MKWSIALVGLLSNSLLSVKAAPVAEAQQAAPTQTASPSASTNPCAVLSASWVAETDSIPKLKPSQVLACLKNVPINIKQAAGFVNYLSTIIQFQSTLSYLKSPPSGYVYPPVDLVGGLDTILNNVNSNGYSNEYDFEVDIHNLMTNARDGHLFIVPVLVGAFVIMREPLVSISDNGINLPKVFFRCKLNYTPRLLTDHITGVIHGFQVREVILQWAYKSYALNIEQKAISHFTLNNTQGFGHHLWPLRLWP